ncbi:Acg family FMN-binding oxidoreductase [Rhodococcus sp. NPDC003318]|uniref:Acg family FMN-binding oxidoreductase n=1 Tax=Rhodococcus sp. NPDC003318 TaxID=3364503 RepID=UPI003673CEA7
MNTTIPDENVIRIAVDLAGRAPSVHNSQPWQWAYAAGQLELHADRSRLLPEADPTGRQLVVSCGAALHHLETALTTLRWATDTVRLPDGADSLHLATVRFHRDAQPRSHDFDLLTAIRHRYSDRRPFGAVGGSRQLPHALPELVGRRAVALTVLPPDARPTLAAATAATASARRYDSAYQAELHWWTGHSAPFGGIPPEALATAESRSRVDIGRGFPAGEDDDTTGAIDAEAIDHSTVLVLSTDTDGPRDWLRAGEALSVVLLEATVDELATCPLTHVTELRQSRAMIRELLPSGGFPQVLVRIGVTARAAAPRQTPRRPVETVLSVGTPRTGP